MTLHASFPSCRLRSYRTATNYTLLPQEDIVKGFPTLFFVPPGHLFAQ